MSECAEHPEPHATRWLAREAAWPYLTSNDPGTALGYSDVCCVASSGLYLGYSPLLPQYNFEIAGLYQFDGGIVDACPSDCIQGVLTDPAFGVGLPVQYIQLGSITNFLLWSQQLGTAPSVSDIGGTTVTPNTTIAPDGTMTADTVTATIPRGDRYQSAYGITNPAGTYWTFSIYMKVASGSQQVQFVIDRAGGVDVELSSNFTVTTSWQRFQFTHSSTWTGAGVVNAGFYIISNGASVICWGAQLEESLQANTYVPTTAGPATTPIGPGLQGTTRSYWVANNFFISPVLDSQASAASTIGDWLEAGQVYCFWSEGLLKFTPLGDTTTVGNGATFTPPTNPIVSLDDDDFIIPKNGDPIKITRSPWQNRWNDVRVEWDVRTNDYNSDVLEVSDAASIQTYGLMREEPKSWRFICTDAAAQFAATLRLQRLTNVVNKYEFMVQDRYWFLEPGDIVEISDGIVGGPVGPLGLSNYPVRILKMVYGDKGIQIEAENYPYSIGTAVLYPKQGQLPSAVLDRAQQDPGDTSALIFEAPDRLAKYQGNVLYILGNSAKQNPNWGGCNVWVSLNGTDYTEYATIQNPGRIGVLAAPLPAYLGANPDLVDTLSVNMAQSGAELTSVGAPDAAAFVTLCGIVNSSNELELISFENATLTGVNQYDLTGLFRGVYQTDPDYHYAGELFARLDPSTTTTYQYDSTYYGKTIYFKFTSFNIYGNQQQSLADVVAYGFVLQGVGPGAIDLNTGNLNPTYNQSIYVGAWNNTTAYLVGNQVTDAGNYYICLVSNTGNDPATSPTYWQAVSTAAANQYLGAWSNVTAYVAGNQVTFASGYYIALGSNTNKEPDTNPTYWELISAQSTEEFLGTYNPSTAYVDGNQVTLDGAYYICISPTTGNTPSQGSAYWTLVGTSALFIGAYSGGTAYLPGNQVTYNNNYYICILATTGNLPTNVTYWQLISLNTNYYTGAYSGGTAYVVGNEVSYSGSYYKCILATVGNLPTNATYWVLVGTSNTSEYLGAWSNSTPYVIGNQVTSAGNYYICIANNTNQNPASSPTYWQQISVADIYLGAWSNATAYVNGNQVTYNGSFYICISGNTNQIPSTTSSYWTLLGTSSILIGAWSNSTAYLPGNQVTYQGVYYTCTTSNTNQAPSPSSIYWVVVGTGSIYIGNWSNSYAYVIGNEVTYNGAFYKAVVANTNQTPSPSSTYWKLMGTARLYMGGWVNTTSYVIGNEVLDNGNIYICLANNTNIEPPNPTYWALSGPSTLDNLADGSIFIKGTAYVASTSIVIPNNAFESSGTTLPPPGWVPPFAGGTLSYLTSGQQSGLRSLALTGPSGCGTASVTKWMCQPGDAFLWSAFAKSDGVGRPFVAIVFIDKNGAIISNPGISFSTSTAWSYQQNTAIAPAGTVCVQVFLYNYPVAASSTVYFDNINLWKLITLDAQVLDGEQRFAATSSTLTYRPLSQPLTAIDAGTYAVVNIASFTMRTSNKGDIAVNSGAITPLSYDTLYYIFYDDPGLNGGGVAFQATITKEVAIYGAGRMFVGSITTPFAGGQATGGNNDGGSGAQNGATYKLSLGVQTSYFSFPTGCSGTTSFSGTHTTLSNPQNACSGNDATYASMVKTAGGLDTIQIVLALAAGIDSNKYTSMTFNVVYEIVSLTGSESLHISAGIAAPDGAGGVSITSFIDSTAVGAFLSSGVGSVQTFTQAVPVGQALSNMIAVLANNSLSNASAISIRIYDVYLLCME